MGKSRNSSHAVAMYTGRPAKRHHRLAVVIRFGLDCVWMPYPRECVRPPLPGTSLT